VVNVLDDCRCYILVFLRNGHTLSCDEWAIWVTINSWLRFSRLRLSTQISILSLMWFVRGDGPLLIHSLPETGDFRDSHWDTQGHQHVRCPRAPWIYFALFPEQIEQTNQWE
jgi:hypothetical protein